MLGFPSDKVFDHGRDFLTVSLPISISGISKAPTRLFDRAGPTQALEDTGGTSSRADALMSILLISTSLLPPLFRRRLATGA